VKCTRCTLECCNPQQAPGSKTPCMTCGQPYGNHCYSRHCATQSAFFTAPEEWKQMVEENKREAGEFNYEDMISVAVKCTGKPEDNS
jgi:hypothetical protein